MPSTPSAPRTAKRRRGLAVSTCLAAALLTAPSAVADHGVPTPDHDATPLWAGQPTYTEQDLAVGGTGGFPNYRIPALTVAPNGDLLASYDGRPTAADAPGPNSILQRRSTDGGQTWGEQTVVRAGVEGSAKEGYSDPSYIVDRVTGRMFNFHVFSMDRGFTGSQTGVDPANRNVLHANVSWSDDDGATWSHRTITADITADLSWRSRFAASGQGIQLRYGPHAGRLLQQYTIINGQGQFQAVSVYSDDHGDTWQVGTPVGVGMDENKTVELSDGRVMLNSRDSHRSGFRKVAYSKDGGVTYGPVTVDRELPDPTNNAAILRAFPNAEQGSDRAKVLLFSNAATSSSRTNGTVRVSCDDGESWPVRKVFQPGAMAYSTLATLPSGRVGLLYEPGHNGIRFAEFSMAWLEGVCAPITPDEQLTIERGDSASTSLTVENQLGPVLEVESLEVQAPQGWTATVTQPSTILPHATARATVTLDVPASASGGTYRLPLQLTDAHGRSSHGELVVVVPKRPEEMDGRINVTGGTHTNPKLTYQVGDRLQFSYRITNLTDAVTTVVPTGNLRDLDPAVDARNCRWRNLPAYGAYTCAFPYHLVTQEDLDRGWFEPVTTWTSTSGDDVTVVEHRGARVPLI